MRQIVLFQPLPTDRVLCEWCGLTYCHEGRPETAEVDICMRMLDLDEQSRMVTRVHFKKE